MQFEPILEKHLDLQSVRLTKCSGGDINEVYIVTAGAEQYIVKINRETDYPEMFRKESEGLDMLSRAGVRTPKTIVHFTDSGYQFLVLEYIAETSVQPGFWRTFARSLARLHRTTHSGYGLHTDNYIGSLIQQNSFKSTWEAFFISCRITPLMEMAFNSNKLNSKHLKLFEHFFTRFNELVPEESPALVHGDLWSGNLMCGTDNTPVFIDPAVYYGHREMDIAMTQLFGGFSREYLNFYNEFNPLEKGWEQRIAIHNLYPNLVHLNLFGRAYLGSIEQVINRF